MEAVRNTVSLTEKVGPPDHYSFTPNTITINNGDSINIVNQTGEDHSLTCTPDAGIDQDALKIDKNEKQAVQFPKNGQYKCSSTEHPDAVITVTVK